MFRQSQRDFGYSLDFVADWFFYSSFYQYDLVVQSIPNSSNWYGLCGLDRNWCSWNRFGRYFCIQRTGDFLEAFLFIYFNIVYNWVEVRIGSLKVKFFLTVIL